MFHFSHLRDMFVPMLGLIGAVIATIGSVLTAVFGPVKKYRLPVESVPGMSRGVLNMLLFAPLLISFLWVTPANSRIALSVSVVALVLAFVCYQKYGGQLNLYRYTKPVPRGCLWFKGVREEIVVGGDQLRPEAEARKKATGRSNQELLADAAYEPNDVWERPGRVAAQLRIERWYYGFMLCTVLTVVLAALGGQAFLSGESPRSTAQRVWHKAFPPSR